MKKNYRSKYLLNNIFLTILILAVPSFSLAKNLCKSDCEPNYEIITDDMNYKYLPKKFFAGKQDQSHVYMWKEKLDKN